MNNTLYKVSLTVFYTAIIIFSVLNFFSDDFTESFIKSISDYGNTIDIVLFLISLIFSVTAIFFIARKKNIKGENKGLWILISIFFPFLLIYFVWKVAPKYWDN